MNMRLKIVGSLILLALAIGATSQFAAAGHHPVLTKDSDPISGEWDVSFIVQGMAPTPAKFTLKLEGDKVTGTAASEHTGPGTIRDGSWKDDKLSFTLDFKSHESIAITGSLKDGKLAGEFRTEGFVSTWEAKRKAAAAVNAGRSGAATTSSAFHGLHRQLYNLFH
jgi:hypothetical protein